MRFCVLWPLLALLTACSIPTPPKPYRYVFECREGAVDALPVIHGATMPATLRNGTRVTYVWCLVKE